MSAVVVAAVVLGVIPTPAIVVVVAGSTAAPVVAVQVCVRVVVIVVDVSTRARASSILHRARDGGRRRRRAGRGRARDRAVGDRAVRTCRPGRGRPRTRSGPRARVVGVAVPAGADTTDPVVADPEVGGVVVDGVRPVAPATPTRAAAPAVATVVSVITAARARLRSMPAKVRTVVPAPVQPWVRGWQSPAPGSPPCHRHPRHGQPLPAFPPGPEPRHGDGVVDDGVGIVEGLPLGRVEGPGSVHGGTGHGGQLLARSGGRSRRRDRSARPGATG